ncbi:AraC family transcriptional regulator [uncultured Microscilla sp.]|uniref:helix-turn-helix domain-containing protein n=1 Tax=uncultured Microscilla sp. TaxID=432653 RepID=UPI002632A557|nr:helix-turn-helix domain-containing protein [uncultured Microscilla sp.]
MSNKIVYLNGIADIYSKNGLSVKQDVGFIINDFKELSLAYPHQSKVYRANYYSFLFIKKGKGNYTMDDKTFEYGNQTVYFANPGHIKSHTFYELNDAFRIAVTEEFFRTYIHPAFFDEFFFLLTEIVPPHTLSDQDFSDIEKLYKQIFLDYNSDSPYKYRVVGHYLAIILFKIKELFWENYQPLEEGNRSSHIVKTFKQNIEQHYLDLGQGKIETLFQVSDYASQQNLNTNYFNQVIKSKTGKTVSTWIAEKSISQAKALLKHSPHSIKEIAFLLGFTEMAHFSNFFKKQTGMSPSNYRKGLKL